MTSRLISWLELVNQDGVRQMTIPRLVLPSEPIEAWAKEHLVEQLPRDPLKLLNSTLD